MLDESSLAFEILFSFPFLRSSHLVSSAARQSSSAFRRKTRLWSISDAHIDLGMGLTEGKHGAIV
jgi:hypothetical protein